ncbi:hypothetical protein Tco_0223584 [Tanacetum coccineum]
MTKVIKGEFEKLETLWINNVLLTCDTSLEIFHDEFNRLSNMDDDLFTYEGETAWIANILCNLNEEYDSEQRMSHESDDDMEYNPSNVEGDDEVELTDEESSASDDEDEVAEIFRIETNVFDFETPMLYMVRWSFVDAIPTKTVPMQKCIQEMAEYSQKWHNGTSRTRSTETSDGLVAIQAQLDNLGREI